jgi:hypothetical protein
MECPKDGGRRARVEENSCVVATLEVGLKLRILPPGTLKEVELRISEAANSIDTDHEVCEKEAVRQM